MEDARGKMQIHEKLDTKEIVFGQNVGGDTAGYPMNEDPEMGWCEMTRDYHEIYLDFSKTTLCALRLTKQRHDNWDWTIWWK